MPADAVPQIAHDAGLADVIVSDLGAAGGEAIVVEGVLTVGLDALRQAHEGWMPAYMSMKA